MTTEQPGVDVVRRRALALIKVPAVRKRKTGAFTLIELLVVIAIIAVLVTILLPMLQEAKQQAYLAVCLTTEQALAKAVTMYAAESDDYLPFRNVSGEDVHWGNAKGGGWLYWIGYVPGRTYCVQSDADGGMQPEELKLSQLWTYVGDVDAWQCPADTVPDEVKLGSRHLSTYMISPTVSDWRNGGVMPYRTEDFTGDAMLFFEGRDRWYDDKLGTKVLGWQGSGDGTSDPGEFGGNFNIRHSGGAVIATYGGSAEWMHFSDFYLELQKKPGRLYSHPHSDTGVWTYDD